MKEHPNFYENLAEAHMRLNRTVVLYDGEPYYIHAITDHKGDSIFRVYMTSLVLSPEEKQAAYNFYDIVGNYNQDYPALGTMLDQAIDGKNTPIVRKMMNSPKFNKFRPFPLGMCNENDNGRTYYVERQPRRQTYQGLNSDMLYEHRISTGQNTPEVQRTFNKISPLSPAFRACVLADHPSAQECLKNLLDPGIANEAVAFHREFALARGPIGMLFLAYKADIVGVLPNNDFSCVRLGREFRHTKEVIEELQLFTTVSI